MFTLIPIPEPLAGAVWVFLMLLASMTFFDALAKELRR